jgi:uncharacterized phage protein (TIGR02218 family)
LPLCEAEFGDARCRADATDPAYSAEATVVAIEGDRSLRVSGLETHGPDWFSRGRARWLTGANVGLDATVRAHDGDLLALWSAPAGDVAPGDVLRVVAGCDKRWETCRDRFGNAANFRGFPHLPGEGWVASYPVEGEPNDGGSRYR